MNGKTNGSNFNCQLFYNQANVCIFITINCIAMAATQTTITTMTTTTTIILTIENNNNIYNIL